MKEFLDPNNIAILILGTLFVIIIIYLHNISKTFPKSPTYGDLTKRQQELFLICQLSKKPEYPEELIMVSKKLRDLDRSTPRRATPGGNYEKSFEALKKTAEVYENVVNGKEELPKSDLDINTAYKSATNDLKGLLRGRPDLSFITNARTKTQPEFRAFYRGLKPEQAEIYSRADAYIPELVQIAEMYHDHMIGTESENGLPFAIVKQTLKYIAHGKK